MPPLGASGRQRPLEAQAFHPGLPASSPTRRGSLRGPQLPLLLQAPLRSSCSPIQHPPPQTSWKPLEGTQGHFTGGSGSSQQRPGPPAQGLRPPSGNMPTPLGSPGDPAVMLMPAGLEAPVMSLSRKRGRPRSQGKMCEGPVKYCNGRGDVNSALKPMWQRYIPADSCLNPALHSQGARGL